MLHKTVFLLAFVIFPLGFGIPQGIVNLYSHCETAQHPFLEPLKNSRRLYRDEMEHFLQKEPSNPIAAAPVTAPDYETPEVKPKFENPLNVIHFVTELVKEAQVTAFAQIQARQATREGERENFAKTPNFIFELIWAISELGQGVFGVSCLICTYMFYNLIYFPHVQCFSFLVLLLAVPRRH